MGDAEALRRLADLYASGEGGAKDEDKAKEFYRISAEKGNADSQWSLAMIYRENPNPAIRGLAQAWFEKSADQNDDERQLTIAFGYSLKKDFVQAAKWIEKSAALGNASAQEKMGEYFRKGQGVPQDFKRAFTWYQKAAEQQNASAHLALGDMYELGEGAPLDLVLAHMHYNVAGYLRDISPEVVASISRVGRHKVELKMTSEQIERAQAQARAWGAEHKQR